MRVQSNRTHPFQLHAITLLMVILLSACKPGPGKPSDNAEAEEAAVPVEVATARHEAIAASYSGTATLEAEREAQVVAKTSGVLLRLRVEEGTPVREGQVLAELDPERPRLELARSEASLKKLENDFKRAQEMFAKKLISNENHDRVRYELETQRAAHELAKLELSYTRIVAPIDGVISQRLVKVGNLIQLQQPLFRIDDFDPLLAVLNVPERELNTLKPGLPVDMLVDALGAKPFQGKVARVAPVVDPQTGTFRVTCEFRDASGTLKSGMFGRIGVVYDRKADALVVPRDALIEEDNETAVFVAVPATAKPKDETEKKKSGFNLGEWFQSKDKKPATADKKSKLPPLQVQRRLVKIGYLSGERAEVLEGLKAGDRVVTVGRAALRDGSLIEVLESIR